jgi:hypothetical protein
MASIVSEVALTALLEDRRPSSAIRESRKSTHQDPFDIPVYGFLGSASTLKNAPIDRLTKKQRPVIH